MVSLLALHGVALAQEAASADTSSAAPDTLQSGVLTEVVVTGSRLSRSASESVQPIQTIDAQIIDERALPDVAAIVSELPSFGTGSTRNGVQGRFGVGQSFADFFSLGSQRTLTLVNGRRVVSSNPATVFYGGPSPGSQVDLNIIPTLLIDRVETVAVGGAPIYGSDAIAGTLNVVLKNRHEGLQLQGEGGVYDAGDGESWRGRALYGFTLPDGRGHLVMSGEYYKADGVLQIDRGRAGQGLSFTPPADPASSFLNQVTSDTRLTFTPGGVPLVGDDIASVAGIRDANGRLLAFGPDGNLRPYDLGQPTGVPYIVQGGESYRSAQYKNLLADTERVLGTVLFDYDLSDSLRLFSEGYFSQVKSRTQNNEPNYNTSLNNAAGQPGGNIVLSLDNPFLAPAARQTIADYLGSTGTLDDPNTFLLTRSNGDLTPGDTRAKIDLWRVVTGLQGDLPIGSRSFTWELAFNYGRSTAANSEPALLRQNFLNAIDAVRATDGSIVCRPGAQSADYPALSSTCAPLNLFGQGAPSRAAVDYISTFAHSRSVNTQRVITASLQGELVDLPGGALRGVLGYESRRESAMFDVDRFYEENLGLDVTAEDASGSFRTNEVFTELRIPIVGPHNAIPFVHRLELQEAFRYVDHSTAGGDPTYTTGLNYAPVERVLLRANYTKSIRAPAITEVNLPTVTQHATANDPCDSRFITSGPNAAARAANCAAAGVPAGFTSVIADNSQPGLQTGNPSLQNEKASSWSVGIAVEPTFLPNVSLSVDWVNIELEDAIELLDAEAMLTTCYDSSNFPSNASCGFFSRGSDGQVDSFTQTYINEGSKELRGLSVALSTQFDLPGALPGSVSMQLNYFYLDRLRSSITGADSRDQAGEVDFSRNKATLMTSYEDGPFSLGFDVTYVGKAVFDRTAAANTYDQPRVGSWVGVDSHIAYTFNDKWTVRLIAENLFNRQAPWPIPVDDIGIASYSSALLGRRFVMNVTADF